ncbi:hemicentin-1 [Cimex lectularius]|uniref:Nephrin n=1 Tax=Cimex lectularius TaxID=79782 RepID=A0A8I6TK11_CIMLE|nr:hemicentin-1 [Cimex lectularius]
MVFWFREDAGIPLYSFDVRGKPLVEGRHWSAPQVFGPRAYFRTGREPATLILKDIRRHDQGTYRCRVDFRNTPTRSFRYNLSVIVPPEYPAVFDKWGKQLNTTIGPHDEGDEVTLTCRVVGGKPEPAVRWLVNGIVVDEEFEHNAGDVIENRLKWRAVTRKDLNSIFSCQASNTQLSEARETSVVLHLYLRPLVVNIISKPSKLIADHRYEVTCETGGSRPPAVITWYKGNRLLRKVREESGDQANITTSTLSFIPSTEDDGKTITCRAENPNVTGLYVATHWNLSVVYPPIVSLRLGSTLNSSDIKEGDDVYFECHIRANPQWRKLSWIHNGELMSHNMSARLILINQSLVLQKVTRSNSGIYSCLASNNQGETLSNEYHLRVKYSPTCRNDRVMIVGASRAESLDIQCQVDADPPARSFKWKFNNSGETFDVGSERFSSNGTFSVLRYTPIADLDYGTLSCWAENNIAVQGVPCLFQVVAAGKPYPVRNCTLGNETTSSLVIWCIPGSDGGVKQVFVLELYVGGATTPRFNVTATETPYFVLTDLEMDVPLKVSIFSVNSKGRSAPVNMEEITLKDPQKRTGEGADVGTPPLLGIIGGAAITFLLIIVIFVSKMRMSNHNSPAMQCKKPTPPTFNAKQQVKDADERDPDIIPAKFEPRTQAEGPAPYTQGKCSWSDSSQTFRGGGDTREGIELNGLAIKEKLMAGSLPESCV